MTDETQIDEQIEGRKRGHSSSASVTSHDPRFSRLLSWFMGALGVGALGVGGWVATSINQLNASVTRLVAQGEAKDYRDQTQDARISRAEDRIEDLRSDVSTLEGKNLRGEARRGR
jgi:hypothetical protein